MFVVGLIVDTQSDIIEDLAYYVAQNFFRKKIVQRYLYLKHSSKNFCSVLRKRAKKHLQYLE